MFSGFDWIGFDEFDNKTRRFTRQVGEIIAGSVCILNNNWNNFFFFWWIWTIIYKKNLVWNLNRIFQFDPLKWNLAIFSRIFLHSKTCYTLRCSMASRRWLGNQSALGVVKSPFATIWMKKVVKITNDVCFIYELEWSRSFLPFSPFEWLNWWEWANSILTHAKSKLHWIEIDLFSPFLVFKVSKWGYSIKTIDSPISIA